MKVELTPKGLSDFVLCFDEMMEIFSNYLQGEFFVVSFF